MLWIGLILSGSILVGLSGQTPTNLLQHADQQDGAPAWAAVRKVLETRCLECHGRDDRKSGLSMATGETFAAGGSRGPVVDPDDLEASRLLAVIGYSNPSLAMPPTGKLPESDLQTLQAWVLAGAPWPDGIVGQLADPKAHPLHEDGTPQDNGDWWAYQPLDARAVPQAEDDHAIHPIDAFINEGIRDAGIPVGDRASPETLLRRAVFDLTGLPPTPEQRASFLRAYDQDAESAWSKLIDSLLASPAYGEHWARHWLDQVRYAETNGYERDGTKTNIWRYRDWVIRALNDDMPYDQFVIEQLAGDELASFAPERPNSDSSLIATGYYRLGVWDDEPADPDQARADELADIVDTTAQTFMGITMGCARCHDHKADPISQRDYYAMTAYFNNVSGYGGGGFGQHLGGGMTKLIADERSPGQITTAERDEQIADLESQLKPFIDKARGEADATTGQVVVSDARTEGAQWRYLLGPAPDNWMLQAFDDNDWQTGQAGFGTAGTPGARIGTTWPSNQITIRTRFRLTSIPDGLILSLHHDEDADVYINGTLVASVSGYTVDYQDLQLPPDAQKALVVGSNTLAISCRQTGGGQYIDAGLRTGWLEEPASWIDRFAAGDYGALDEADVAQVDERLAQIDRLRNIVVADAYPALVVSERGSQAPEQFINLRGSVHAPGDAVGPEIPAVLAWAGQTEPITVSSESNSTGRRLAFANWLVHEGQFISARVMANRLWQFHFGRGLCRSAGDFGRLGDRPTHPALLDHLATELIARDWSLKDMHRYLMTSEVYRRTSRQSVPAQANDPRNDTFSNFDQRRLSAEEYRDAVLAVAGLANDTMFGPSVYPPLPEAVLATASRPDHAWGTSSEADARRRSIYVFSKRSLRPPLMESLDQPDPDRPCPVRFPTNVPTQALMTINGDFTNNAADAFAARLDAETGSLDEAVRRGVLLALCRSADDEEVDRHLAFMGSLREDHNLNERDALRVFCLMLFNLNEFMWVD